MTMGDYYYHAGVELRDHTVWSTHTRMSRAAARAEAVRLARASGGSPVVEWWDRAHGMRPGDGDVVAGGEYV